MRWLNRSQPQTLYSSVLLCYFSAGFLLFGSRIDWQLTLDVFEPIVGLFASDRTAANLGDALVPFGVTLLLGGAFMAGGLGTANERRWGHGLCTAAASYSALATVWWTASYSVGLGIVMRLMFDVLLLVLIFHPLSRNHRRIWFQ